MAEKSLSHGPLPMGWHRVTWYEGGQRLHVVTDDIMSAAMVLATVRGKPFAVGVDSQSWSDYPASTIPTLTITEPTDG